MRTLHGVTDGEYSYHYSARNAPRILNNERNALAFLLTLPWTENLWSMDGVVRYANRSLPYPTADDLASLLIQAQSVIPSMTAPKLGLAIRTLALSNPRATHAPNVFEGMLPK